MLRPLPLLLCASLLSAQDPPPAPSFHLGLGVSVATGLGSMSSDLNGHPGFGFQVQAHVPITSGFELRPAFEWTGYRTNDYDPLVPVAAAIGASYSDTRLVFRTYRLGLDGLWYLKGGDQGLYTSAGVGLQHSRAYLESVYDDGQGGGQTQTLATSASKDGLWLGAGLGYQWEQASLELRLSRAPYDYTASLPLASGASATEARPGWALHLMAGVRF
ncbi:MAG TPA: hypothetical protein VJ600_11305 [Holophagaceae bacterium]|nr:hypothetical protein [Holophagaceae bacterium]